MTARFSIFSAFVVSICTVSILPAQEVSSPSPAPASSPTPAQLTDVLFKNLKARSIGPAVMGGRFSDIAIDPHNAFAFYVGLGHGGVFKTNDNGVMFESIRDKQPILCFSAVAVAPY